MKALTLGRTVSDYAVRVWDNSRDDNLLFLASGIAFDILLAVVPFVLFLASGVSYVLNLSAANSLVQIGDVVDRMLPPHAESLDSPVHRVIGDALRTHGSLGLWSALIFLFLSTRLFSGLRTALAEVFDIEHERGIIEGKLFDIKMTLMATLLFVANTVLSAYLALVRSRGLELVEELGVQHGAMGELEYVMGKTLAFVILAAMFFALYKFLPNRRVCWQSAMVASVFTSLLFELAKQVFARFAHSFNPASFYSGTLAAIVVVLVWTYYAAVIFILGGEVGQVYELRRVRAARREVFTD